MAVAGALGGERDGYVPNVVYSCGGMLHERTLVLPYGWSDAGVGFATVDLDELLACLAAHASPLLGASGG